MSFIAIILVNALLVIGGGELADKTVEHVKSNDKRLTKIHEEVQKKTTFNINVKPVINFKPTIGVNPTINSDNRNVNKSTNEIQNKHNIVDGE